MRLLTDKRLQIGVALAIGATTVIVLFFIWIGGSDQPPPASVVSTAPQPEGFTFFDVGTHTVYTDDIRTSLSHILGSDVLETRSTIDLTTNGPGFIRSHFPEIHRLQTKLNDQTGARIEHNIIKLTYRYALRENAPFFFVELVFSNYSKKPLYFRIKAKKEGAGIVDKIKTKYGEPEGIDGANGWSQAVFWKRTNDIFVVSRKKDRFGDPEFHLMIYFVDHLQQLVSIEDTERKQQEENRKKAVKEAF